MNLLTCSRRRVSAKHSNRHTRLISGMYTADDIEDADTLLACMKQEMAAPEATEVAAKMESKRARRKKGERQREKKSRERRTEEGEKNGVREHRREEKGNGGKEKER